MIDLPAVLYVINSISFCCTQDVPAKALRMLFLPDTLSVTWPAMLNDRWVSRETPNIVGHLTALVVSPRMGLGVCPG